MGIDEPRSLKKRINDGRTAEFHAALFKILGDGVGDRRGCAKSIGLDDGTGGQKGLKSALESLLHQMPSLFQDQIHHTPFETLRAY